MENELSTYVANSGSRIASESLLDRKTSYRAPGVCRMALGVLRWLANRFTLWHVEWRPVNAERVVLFWVYIVYCLLCTLLRKIRELHVRPSSPVIISLAVSWELQNLTICLKTYSITECFTFSISSRTVSTS